MSYTNDASQIKFKSKKSILILGILLLASAALVEETLIAACAEHGFDEDEIIMLVIVSIFFVGMVVLMGAYAVYIYFQDGKCIRKGLERYGKENIIANINQATMWIYQNSMTGRRVYFTDRLVVDPTEAILEYGEIGMMYKHVTRSRYGHMPSLAFGMLDGNTYYLCGHIQDAEMENLMRLCQRYNSRILFGYTKQNQELHKQNVQRYKSGMGNR